MRVVLDTNVVVSRFLSPHGTPARVLGLWEDGTIEVVVSEPVLEEYARVLAYDQIRARHRMTDDEFAAIISGFRAFAIVVEPTQRVDVVADDPSDNMFLEAAIAGRCEAVVSGDRHLLDLGEYQGVQVLSAAAFVVSFDG